LVLEFGLHNYSYQSSNAMLGLVIIAILPLSIVFSSPFLSHFFPLSVFPFSLFLLLFLFLQMQCVFVIYPGLSIYSFTLILPTIAGWANKKDKDTFAVAISQVHWVSSALSDDHSSLDSMQGLHCFSHARINALSTSRLLKLKWHVPFETFY
jgi:hypothetical protein